MRKLILFLSASFLLFSSQIYAMEFPEGASPSFYDKVTAYSSQYFDRVMQQYGLQFNPAANVPKTYAKVVDGKVVFNEKAMAYTPAQYHTILLAYGLQLSPDSVRNKLTVKTYAKIVDGAVVFDNKPRAYGGERWKNIIGAYNLPPKLAMDAKPGDDDGDGVPNDKDACPWTPRYAVVDSRGCWALGGSLLFEFDKAEIKSEYYSLLDETKKVFDEYPGLKVVVEGHADSVGSDSYNRGLSQRRAQAVVDYLVGTVGVGADRLEAVGYGESTPVASNETEDGRAKNRRVQFSPAQFF